MNYFAVHKQSNTTFYPATDGRLSQYYARLKFDTPIDIYSIIGKPKTPEILPLTPEGKIALTDYVLKHRQHETTEAMASAWRVSERTIRDILSKLTTPLPLTTL